MEDQREIFAMDVIGEAVKQRNHWRLAFCISLAGNVLLATILIFE